MPPSARPTTFRKKWRIRWLDHEGTRRSAVFETHEEAERELRKKKLETDEIRRGLRRAVKGDRCFDDLADYWLKNRAPEKRSRADDESIIRRHLRPCSVPQESRHSRARESGRSCTRVPDHAARAMGAARRSVRRSMGVCQLRA